MTVGRDKYRDHEAAPRLMKRFVLARRPQGMPVPEDFRLEQVAIPTPADGELLIKAHYLSVDPLQRSRMQESSRYGSPMPLDEAVWGRMVGEVVQSRNPAYREGEFVHGMLGWQEYALSDGSTDIRSYAPGLTRVDPSLAPVSTAVGIMGMPGATAYFSLFNIGKPQRGETVLISAAAGAVGSAIGQMAKIIGCKVYGLAGSQDKVDYLMDELGFDGCLNYRGSADLAADIGRMCPDGIDIYADLVGGAIRHAVLEHLRPFARIPLIGFISHVNGNPPMLPDATVPLMAKRVHMEGFIIYDHVDRMDEFRAQMSEWIRAGLIRFPETVTEGFESLPEAFVGVLEGRNIGKSLVKP